MLFQNHSIGNVDNNWDFGDDTYSQEINPIHFYEDPGTYIVSLIITNEVGCMDTISHEVEIFAQPEAAFTISEKVGCENTEITLTNTSSQEIYVEWTVETLGTFTNEESITFTLQDTGFYDVGIIAYYNEQCTDTLFLEEAIRIYKSPIAAFEFENDFGSGYFRGSTI